MWEINQKITPTPNVILPLDESESSVPNKNATCESVVEGVHMCWGPECKAKDSILDFSVNNVAFVKLIMPILYSDSFMCW
jgi:hypothetical protein